MTAQATPLSPITAAYVQTLLPPRHAAAHKGTFGSLTIIGGNDGMLGALTLTTRAALLSGTGKVFAVSVASQPPVLDSHQPEIMYRDITDLMVARMLEPSLKEADLKDASLKEADLKGTGLTQQENPTTAFVVGPGLGQTALALQVLTFCLQQPRPILLDADALNLVANHPALQARMLQRTAASIITPHPAEAARLLNQSVKHIQKNREASARLLAQRFNAVCVLKGAGTLIAQPDVHHAYLINTSGNVALATAGTGDVLSGIIGSLLAQGVAAVQAATLGVYVHGAAADALVASGIGPIGLTASEVAVASRQILNQLYQAQYG